MIMTVFLVVVLLEFCRSYLQVSILRRTHYTIHDSGALHVCWLL